MDIINIIIKAIFIENMVLAFFLGMCSVPGRLQESIHRHRTGRGGNLCAHHHGALQLVVARVRA